MICHIRNRNLDSFPVSGALYDAIGNYESGFYFAGTMIFISGVMLFVLPWMERKRDERRRHRSKAGNSEF